jgi:hypothetical protein
MWLSQQTVVLSLGSCALPIWTERYMSTHIEKRKTRFPARLAMLLVALTMLFADEIAGRIYLSHLCATKTEVKVFRTVELPVELWDQRGKPRFYNDAIGNFNLTGYELRDHTTRYSAFFHIDKSENMRVEKSSGQVLGETVNFRYWGGWLRRNFGLIHNSANSCSGGLARTNLLIEKIFRPAKS